MTACIMIIKSFTAGEKPHRPAAAMAHKVKMLPAEASCREEESAHESVVILIQHCRDMRQQETRLRLLTLLLLLGCAALYVFTICAELRKGEQKFSGEQRAAGPLQERQSTAGAQSTVSSAEKKRFHIHLSSINVDTQTDGQTMMWEPEFPEVNDYNQERHAIVIPESGVYYIYSMTSLVCRNDSGTPAFSPFYVQIFSWNESYKDNESKAEASDGLLCPPVEQRTVFVGQQVELSKGDHLSMKIGAGYRLIERSTFGAYLVDLDSA